MNRVIKFRAWDTRLNRFVGDGEIVFRDYGDTSIEVYPNSQEYAYDSCHNGEPQGNRFIVMQFTGLHDKNGKEIYEGDIMGWESLEGTKHQIRWVVEFDPQRGYKSWSSTKNDEIVIGNRFENPELCE